MLRLKNSDAELKMKTSAVYINAKAVEVVSQMITEDLQQTIQKDSSFKTLKMSERVFKCMEGYLLKFLIYQPFSARWYSSNLVQFLSDLII